MSDALLALARDLPPGIVPHLLRTCKTETKKYLSRRTVCTNFINFNLKLTTPCTPENLAKQISDGKTLYQLGQVLFQENWPVLPNNCDPKKAIADSINFLFEMGVQVGEGSAARIADGDEETTLGLIWNMLDCCLVKPVNFIDEVTKETKIGEEGLLLWSRSKTKDGAVVHVTAPQRRKPKKDFI